MYVCMYVTVSMIRSNNSFQREQWLDERGQTKKDKIEGLGKFVVIVIKIVKKLFLEIISLKMQ